jgi:hypothetical protein
LPFEVVIVVLLVFGCGPRGPFTEWRGRRSSWSCSAAFSEGLPLGNRESRGRAPYGLWLLARVSRPAPRRTVREARPRGEAPGDFDVSDDMVASVTQVMDEEQAEKNGRR